MSTALVEKLFPHMKDRIDSGCCPLCGEPVNMNDFKDDLSRREYEISKMCQKCQDSVFD
jgi:hypothetical protein